MSSRRLLAILLLLLILALMLQPRAVWAEVQRIRRRWNLALGLVTVVILGYLLYGLYIAWQSGGYGAW